MTDKMCTRGVSISNGKPATFNDSTQSVRVVAVTENPVRVWDGDVGDFVREVLLVNGVSLPPGGKVPLLDSHNRNSVIGILGSARNFIANGTELECEVYFSGTDAGRNTAMNVKEGHLTDFSVGYSPSESYYIPEGKSQEVFGRTYQGPVKVTPLWELRELSVTAIGADPFATARSLRAEESVPGGKGGEPAPSPQTSPDSATAASSEPSAGPEPKGGVPPSDESEKPASPAAEGKRQIAVPPAKKPAQVKKPVSVVDAGFYIFVALMILSLLAGLF